MHLGPNLVCAEFAWFYVRFSDLNILEGHHCISHHYNIWHNWKWILECWVLSVRFYVSSVHVLYSYLRFSTGSIYKWKKIFLYKHLAEPPLDTFSAPVELLQDSSGLCPVEKWTFASFKSVADWNRFSYMIALDFTPSILSNPDQFSGWLAQLFGDIPGTGVYILISCDILIGQRWSPFK